MQSRTCYAVADTPRAVVALLFPVLLITSGIYGLTSKGYSVSDYILLLVSGHLSWFRQGVGWIALLVWVARYFPPAWIALWHGPCLLSADSEALYLARGHSIDRSDVSSVSINRGLFQKSARIRTSSGIVNFSLIFVRPASDVLLRSLAPGQQQVA